MLHDMLKDGDLLADMVALVVTVAESLVFVAVLVAV